MRDGARKALGWAGVAAGTHLARLLGIGFGLLLIILGQFLEPKWFIAGVGAVMVPYALFAPWMRKFKLTRDGLEIEHNPNPEQSTELATQRTEIQSQQAPPAEEPVDDQPTAVLYLDEDETLAATRIVAADAAMAGLMQIDRWIPGAQGNMHLYGYDEEAGVLSPIFEADPAPSNSWKPGCGATGTCYETGEFQVAIGDDVVADRWNLTEEQRAHYTGLTAVAAVPVVNSAGGILGVISTSSRSPDHRLNAPGAANALADAAACVARVFVDLLGWYPDDTAGE